MSRFRIVIQRIEDDGATERVTELDRIDVAAPDARLLQPETALDHLEAQTLATGHEVMRHLLTRQWERVDEQRVAHYRELFPPVSGEGGRPRPDQGGLPAGGAASAPASAGRPKRRSPAPGK
jgi:hypothetical protein